MKTEETITAGNHLNTVFITIFTILLSAFPIMPSTPEATPQLSRAKSQISPLKLRAVGTPDWRTTLRESLRPTDTPPV